MKTRAQVQPGDIEVMRNYYDDFFFRADSSSLGVNFMNSGSVSEVHTRA